MSQLLPLALWDGKYGVIKILPSDFKREVLCKIYTVAALGVFQPFLLLLGCFLCSHALRYAACGGITSWRQQTATTRTFSYRSCMHAA